MTEEVINYILNDENSGSDVDLNSQSDTDVSYIDSSLSEESSSEEVPENVFEHQKDGTQWTRIKLGDQTRG